jgi:uncharacterized protein
MNIVPTRIFCFSASAAMEDVKLPAAERGHSPMSTAHRVSRGIHRLGLLLAAVPLLVGALIVAIPHTSEAQSGISWPFGPKFPVLTGRVVDEAKLLSQDDERELIAKLKALEDETSDQLVVVTIPSLQGYSIEDYGIRLGNHWGIAHGVLLIIAPNERKVRIEVSTGLTTTLSDEIAQSIIDKDILPSFRAGNYPAGIKEGVEAMFAVLSGQQRPPAKETDRLPQGPEGPQGVHL